MFYTAEKSKSHRALATFLAILLFASIAFSPAVLRSAAYADTPISLDIQYTQPVVCGTPTTFTFVASGGPQIEPYKYKPVSLYVNNGGSSSPLADFSYKGFSSQNTFQYTFTVAGNYTFTASVFFKKTDGMYGYQDFSTTFNVGGGSTMDQILQQANAKANQAWAACQAANCTTDYDKALWLHDWLINNMEYDNSLTLYQWYNAFVDGKGTCEAYHAAYGKLLTLAGLEWGKAYDEGHIWTTVKINGEWVHIDTTNNDTSTNLLGSQELDRHLIFGLNDDILNAGIAAAKDQAPTGQEIKGKNPNIALTSLSNNYFIKTGKIKTYSTPLYSSVQTQITQGKTSFSINVPLASLPSKYKAILYSLVAYDLKTKAWNYPGTGGSLNVSYSANKLDFTVTASSSQPPTQPPVQPPTQPVDDSIPMYRLYNPYNSEHFYTASEGERDILAAYHNWIYEGIGWYAPKTGAPVYRLYNPGLGDHHYTTSASERDVLVRYYGWNYEGIGWYSGGNTPLYRHYNPGLKSGSHHYTTSAAESQLIVANFGWKYEGIAWYGVK